MPSIRDDVLARGRVRAEAGMADACVIRRRTGEATDDFSGATTTTFADIYTGPCRVKQAQALPETHDAGEDYVTLTRLELQVPVAATGIRLGDEATMTASLHDPDLPGKVLLIRAPAAGSEITARRFEVTERTG